MKPCAPPLSVAPLLAVLTVSAPACSPSTMMVEGGGEDLAPAPADLTGGVVCGAEARNLLSNTSFEGDALPGDFSARNTGQPKSTIKGPWDACCNTNNQGLTTTFKVVDTAACYGRQSISVTAAAAQADVLNQAITITDGANRMVSLGAWVRVVDVGQNGALSVDLFDLATSKVLGTTPQATQKTAGVVFVPIVGAATLPAASPANLQVRVKVSGTITAFVDDLSLTLK